LIFKDIIKASTKNLNQIVPLALLLDKLNATNAVHSHYRVSPMKHTLQLLAALLIINTSVMAFAHAGNHADNNNSSISKALNHESRPEQDKTRDAARKPAEILKLVDVKPGMKVVDYIAGGGYYSEIFARVLDNKGHLYSVKGRLDKRELKQYNNVTVLSELDLTDLNEPVDRIFTALNYHDMVNKKELDRAKVLKTIHSKLKDDGYLIVIDHNTSPGRGTLDTKKKHRIDNAFVLNEIQNAGFILDASSSVLANPNDNFDLDVWQESTKGKTDRFVYRFKKNGGKL
jgi:predicted methyltransferase